MQATRRWSLYSITLVIALGACGAPAEVLEPGEPEPAAATSAAPNDDTSSERSTDATEPEATESESTDSTVSAAPTSASTASAEATVDAELDPPTTDQLPVPEGGLPKLSLTETYSSEQWGYAIDHPSGWEVQGSGPVAILQSRQIEGPGRDGVPADITKIDIVPLEGMPVDLEARAEQIRGELDAITEEASFRLMSGQPAIWLRGRGAMTVDTGIVLSAIGDQLFQLQAYGDPRPLPAIAFTFRAMDASSDAP